MKCELDSELLPGRLYPGGCFGLIFAQGISVFFARLIPFGFSFLLCPRFFMLGAAQDLLESY